MALGPGWGEGFTSGLNAMTAHREAQAKMEALQQDSLNKKLDFYTTATQAAIKDIADLRAATAQDGPALQQATTAQQEHIMDTIKGIAQLGDKGRTIAGMLSSQLANAMQTPTLATKTTNEELAKQNAAIESTKAQAKALGIAIPADQGASVTAGLGQPAPGLGGAPGGMPIPNAPTPPPSAPDQQMAGGPGATTPLPGAPGGGVGMTAPSAPGMTDQATASQGIPSQTMPTQGQPAPDQAPAPAASPIQLNPTGTWRKQGAVNTGNIPIQDIELVLVHPEAASAFQQTYGVDPSTLMAPPPEPGAAPSFNDLLKQKLGIKESALDTAMGQIKAKAYNEELKAYNDAKRMLHDNYQSRLLLWPKGKIDKNTGQPNEPGIYTGILSGPKLIWARMMQESGRADPETIAKIDNTQTYIGNIASQTATIIKRFGAGTGLSDADREFAARAAGGDISMSAEALDHILEINSKAALFVMSHPDLAVQLHAQDPADNSAKE